MKTCKYCKEEINGGVTRCPKCGGNLGMSIGLKILIGFIALIIVAFACLYLSRFRIDQSYKDSRGRTEFKINETFKNKYEKITMSEVNTNFTDYYSLFEPEFGKKYIMIKLDIENISNRPLHISSIDFIAEADDIMYNPEYIGNDNYKVINTTVESGEKTSGYLFYKIPTDSESIKIKYTADIIENNKSIEFIVK